MNPTDGSAFHASQKLQRDAQLVSERHSRSMPGLAKPDVIRSDSSRAGSAATWRLEFAEIGRSE